MNSFRARFLIRVGALALFALMNFVSFKAFSSQDSLSNSLPACELASEGYVENQWKNIRIQVNNAVVAGAETLSDLAGQLAGLVSSNKCLPAPVPCSFASEGTAVGAWVKHRIVVSDAAIFGANTTARVFEQLGQLQKMGICE